MYNMYLNLAIVEGSSKEVQALKNKRTRISVNYHWLVRA
jgi:hypothetical protein